jgi:hypothetical protein
MKKLILIALLLSFLVGNAQQARHQYGPNNTKAQVQIYTGINPGFPTASDLNRNKIRKTDNDAEYPIAFDLNRYTIRNPDNTEYPGEIDLNRYTIRKPDDTGYSSEIDLNRYTIRKPD